MSTPPAAASYHHGNLREALIEAAIDVARERGPDGLALRDLARRVGVSHNAAYRHFADRADLQRAVSEHAADMLMQRIYPVLAIDAEPIEHVAAVIDAYLGMIEDEPQLYRFVVANPAEPVPGAEIAQDVRGQIGALLTTLFGERLRAEGRDSGGAEAWAHGIIGMVQTAGEWWLERRTMSRDALTNYLSALIWGGIAGVAGIDSPTANADILRLVPEPQVHDASGRDR